MNRVIYGDKQDTLDLFSGPKSKFLNFEYSARLFSIKLFNWIRALALEASNIISSYFDFFFFRPNLSLCLNLKTTIAAAINKIATAS